MLLNRMERAKIIVIGAGLAGLTAAYRLLKLGYDVEVYEARARVGGRVLTVSAGGTLVELGGQSLEDGGECENLYRLIDELKLPVTTRSLLLDMTYFDGTTFLPLSELLQAARFEPKALLHQINRYSANASSLADVMRQLFDECDPLYKALAVRLAAYEGGPIEKLSPSCSATLYQMLLGGTSPAHPAGEAFNLVSLQGGNSRLPAALAQTLEGRVHLGRPLRRVGKNAQGQFLLEFGPQESCKADLLVLALPCSVYRNIVFEEDALPRQRQEAMHKVAYGSNAKIVVPCSAQPKKQSRCFNDRVISFYDSALQNLTLYYVDQASHFCKETIPHTYARDREMLEKNYGSGLSALLPPEHSNDLSYSSYAGPVGHSWPTDPFAQGSYSFIAAGAEKEARETTEVYGETVKSLFAPVRDALYFAGEHTCPNLAATGTMEAACASGELTARLIAKTLKR